MSYVFLVPKKFDTWTENVVSGHFSVHFRRNFRFRWNFRRKKFSWNIFIEPKDSSLNFRGGLSSYFWAIVLISAVISILEDFGSLLPARTVTVNFQESKHILHKVYSAYWSKSILADISCGTICCVTFNFDFYGSSNHCGHCQSSRK